MQQQGLALHQPLPHPCLVPGQGSPPCTATNPRAHVMRELSFFMACYLQLPAALLIKVWAALVHCPRMIASHHCTLLNARGIIMLALALVHSPALARAPEDDNGRRHARCLQMKESGASCFLRLSSAAPGLPSGVRCSVVAMANSIDITERSLPALKCRGCTPEFLPFTAYSRPQVRGACMRPCMHVHMLACVDACAS